MAGGPAYPGPLATREPGGNNVVMPLPPTGDPISPVIELLTRGDGWLRASFTPARGTAPWDRTTASPVALRGRTAVKLVTRNGKAESTRTVELGDWPSRLAELTGTGAMNLDVLAPEFEWHARRTRGGRWLVSKGRPSIERTASPSAPARHDRPKRQALAEDNERVRELFIATGLFSKNGVLLGDAAGKFRQVQHYLDLLRPLAVWDAPQPVKVVDAGCGKAYLSLALYLWAELRRTPIELTGIDTNAGVIASVQETAERLGYSRTRFEACPIIDHAASGARTDLLVSLHACDTATDEALAAGVRMGAQAIVLAPCCHKELAGQVEANLKSGALPAGDTWAAVNGSGLLRHRMVEIVTDALRAAALEALGYEVDVIDWVASEATARNVMIRAELTGHRDGGRSHAEALGRYRALAGAWGVAPALERLLGPAWPPAGAAGTR